jgi:hypothetical protein
VLGLPQNCDPADEAYIQIRVVKLYLISDLHGPLFVGFSKRWKKTYHHDGNEYKVYGSVN